MNRTQLFQTLKPRRVGRRADARRPTGCVLVLLGENSLRQRIAGAVLGQRVVGVDDPGLAVLRVDGYLEQIEQVARARLTGDAAGADRPDVIRTRRHLGLRERRSAVRALSQVDVTGGARL